MAINCEFDSETHTYWINGRPVPSVTQVLRDLLPQWEASDWYLQRGRAVHACAAMVAQGLDFDHDPRIAGQIEACRRFCRDMQPMPELVEEQVYSRKYQFAGTVDLVVSSIQNLTIPGKARRLVIDYKSSLTKVVPIQLAAYSVAIRETFPDLSPREIRYGLGVQLNADGTYKCSEIYDLKRYKAQWLALLTAFNLRRETGIKEATNGSE